VDLSFHEDAEWVSSALFSARIEQAALLQLLLRKQLITAEDYLNELAEIVSDDFEYSIRHFVAQSEKQLRAGRWHIGGEQATDQLARRLALGPDDSVLDIGCGIGGPTRQIAERFGCNVVGIDIRFERIVEALLRTAALGLRSRVQFHVAAGERLPFEDEVFDAVVSQATLNWVPDKPGVVREMFRVLKKGGRLGFECEALTEKAEIADESDPRGLFRVLAWQQLLDVVGFADIRIEEMWEESRRFYPSGPEREQIDRGERVNVRILARKP